MGAGQNASRWLALFALLRCAGPGCQDEATSGPPDAGSGGDASTGEPDAEADAGAPGTWFPMTDEGAPEARADHFAVWTGSEMIVYGGHEYQWQKDELNHDFRSGGRYDPRTDTWSSIRYSPIAAPIYWTGSELLIFGATHFVDGPPLGGALYDSQSETWRPISLDGAPDPNFAHLWAGSALFVWGAPSPEDDTVSAGAVYDPVTDTWSAISDDDAPTPRRRASTLWTGREVLVWGGAAVVAPWPERTDGGLYDPATNTWRPIAPGGPAGIALDAVWSGTAAIVLKEEGEELVPYLYDPVRDTWTIGASVSLLLVKTPVAWIGDRVLFWGGNSAHNMTEYDPRADVWTISLTRRAPHWNEGQSCLWTGNELILWGGFGMDYSASGSRFVPAG